MEEELAFADSDPLSTCSNSSLLPHCSSGELFEESLGLKSPPSENRNVARTKKLLHKYNLVIPELKVKTGEIKKEAVDLALPNEKLDPWLTKKFPLIKKRITPCEASDSKVQKGFCAQQNVKKELLARMAVRRKVEQQRRKQLYTEDNEDVQGNSTEEDEDIMPKKKEKTKLKAAKPKETDNSEDDEDYVAEEEEEENSESSGNENDDVVNESLYCPREEVEDNLPMSSFKESVDIFGSESPLKSISLESDKNIFKINSSSNNACTGLSSESRNSLPPIDGPSQFPSFSQWYTSGSDKLRGSRESVDELSDELNTTVANEPVNTEDLLMFCSGQFDVPAAKVSEVPLVHKSDNEIEENDDGVKQSLRKPRRLVESDDDDEETVSAQNTEHAEEQMDNMSEIPEERTRGRKVILMSDDEDEEDANDKIIQDDLLATVGEDLEEEFSEEEEEIDKESEEEVEGNDSDDELAVIRRLENKEHKRKLKRGKFFDDEASLSGSDVGSDGEEDPDSNDEYEVDECDKEQFDEEDLRNQNHKLFLKQQQQQVHREIAKLQDRLLADGDLAGVETNRTFRVRLREDVEVDMNELNEFSQDALLDEDNVDEDKKRADAIKFRAEMHSVLLQTDDDPLDDDIERAANAASLTEVTEAFSQQVILPTLIGKTPLVGVFKDINGSVATRQMFTNTADSNTTKRIFEPHPGQPKRLKLTLFDTLDE